MKPSHKSNRTIDGEIQVTSDSRLRRLIPYMSYYYPGNDYKNYQSEFLPVVNLNNAPMNS